MKMSSLTLAGALVLALGAVTAAVAQSSGESKAMAKQTGGAVTPGDVDGAFVSFMKFSEPDGAKLYTRVCAGCHMPDAMGAKGAGFYPALAKNPKLEASGYPLTVVLNGMHGMPAVGKMMSDQQVADVVNYVRGNFGNRYRDKVTAADVKGMRQ